jgi:hypothetical protein
MRLNEISNGGSGSSVPCRARPGYEDALRRRNGSRQHLSGRSIRLSPRFSGGRTRTRTLDPLIKSQLLYQLSYAP